MITQVSAKLVSDSYWEYTLLATASVYQGVYMDRWRELLGNKKAGGVSLITAGGGTVAGTPPIHYLGGSRFFPVEVPA
jgi:hypothetical protein